MVAGGAETTRRTTMVCGEFTASPLVTVTVATYVPAARAALVTVAVTLADWDAFNDPDVGESPSHGWLSVALHDRGWPPMLVTVSCCTAGLVPCVTLNCNVSGESPIPGPGGDTVRPTATVCGELAAPGSETVTEPE